MSLMQRTGAVLTIVFAVTAARPAAAQSAAPVTTTAITATDLRTRLTAFAHDSMMGRQPGTKGNFMAAAYVESEFRRLGLEPAGENGTFFQTVPMVREYMDSSAVLFAGDTPLHALSDFLPVFWLESSIRTLDSTPTVFGGDVADSSTWITAEQARGKVVLFRMPPPTGQSRPVRANSLLGLPRFAGAVAIVLELQILPPPTVAQAASGRIRLAEQPPSTQRPLVYVTPRAAEAILGKPLQSAAAGQAGKPLRGSLATRRDPLPFPARNVIGILRGSDPALRGEYVSLSAHNDHVGFNHNPVDHDSIRAYDRVVRPMGADSPARPATAAEQPLIRKILDSLRAIRPARPDSIMNGADDDGSGTVALLEVAEALVREKPRRSILFVSHTAEEYGLVGSLWFTSHPTVPRDSIVGEIDEDMVGRGSATDVAGGGPTYLEVVGAKRLSTEFGELLEQANAAQPLPFKFNYEFDAPGHPLQYYCRADHFSYARYGIPSVAISRGEHLDYHQVTDESQYIDYDVLARVARLTHDAALRVANLDHRPKLDRPKQDPRTPCVQ
jgi:hypothetical protein